MWKNFMPKLREVLGGRRRRRRKQRNRMSEMRPCSAMDCQSGSD